MKMFSLFNKHVAKNTDKLFKVAILQMYDTLRSNTIYLLTSDFRYDTMLQGKVKALIFNNFH